MVRHAALALGLTACFGSGPEPMLAPDVTVVFRVDPQVSSCNGTFIADVQLGSTIGVALTAPYIPWNNCGGSQNTGPMQVYSFPKAGGAGAMVGTAGNNNSGAAIIGRVAATTSSALWAVPDTSMPTIDVDPIGISLNPMTTGNNPNQIPAGFVVDTATTPPTAFVGGWSTSGGLISPMSPYFPCCGGSSPGAATSDSLFKVPLMSGAQPTKLPVSPTFFCENGRTCLVQNTDHVYYIQHADPSHVASINGFPKSGTSPGEETVLGYVDGGYKPTSIAADDTHVAFSTSLDFTQLGQDQNGGVALPTPTCVIDATTTDGLGSGPSLMTTTAFSCTDIAVDDHSVYFTITELTDTGHGVVANGLGVGRVAFAGGAVETLALGLNGLGSGPREIVVDGDSIYLLDPFEVVRIPKTALDGRIDITP